MSSDVQILNANQSLADALKRQFGPQQKHRAFPAVRDGVLLGMLDRDALIRAHEATPHARVGNVFGTTPPHFALLNETCRAVAARLAARSLDRVPVVADATTMQLTGIVSRHDLVRPSLSIFNDEWRHERFRRTGFRLAKPVQI